MMEERALTSWQGRQYEVETDQGENVHDWRADGENNIPSTCLSFYYRLVSFRIRKLTNQGKPSPTVMSWPTVVWRWP